MTSFNSLDELLLSVASMLKPAERLTVSQAAEKYRYVNSPGSYVGQWNNETAPMMVEVMDVFISRDFKGAAFCGPAQCGKTDSIVINTIVYAVKCEPMDMMLVCPTNVAGRDFSIRRIDRLHLHSTEVGAMLLPGSDADNTFDKRYRNGMLFSISWPTPTELAGKPIGRIVLTDYDRMPLDVGGDGNPFDLASKRTTTFGSYAMTFAESSPSHPIENTKWVRRTSHEAPPCQGILSVYNRGDRRRWYWPCPSCGTYFEGTFEMLTYERHPGWTNLEIAETVMMQCPHCPHHIHPDDRDEMQQRGRWVKDGQNVDKEGNIFGTAPRTMLASFWMNGVAAVFTNWKNLVAQYLDACDDYDRTGSEDALKKFYNNDLGMPYVPKSIADLRLPEVLKGRAEKVREQHVPEGVRFLVATIDVQKNMFKVQVTGILPGKPFDTIIVDAFEIRKSKRVDQDGERLWVKPHAYLEDWDEITEHVLNKEYPLDDDSGRMMSIKFTACDSHGKDGVTSKAYDYYRKLRETNEHRRFILLRGDPTVGIPRTRITYPDSSRKDIKAGARGEIPVLQLNSNLLKDDLNGRLDVIEPMKGMFRMPDWLPDRCYAELCVEVKTDKGWENPSNLRNETWDLSYYTIGLCVSELLRVEHIDWSNPPGWCAPWDSNLLVRKEAEPAPFANTIKSAHNFADLAKALA